MRPPQFARRLVYKRFSFVSVLHGGMDALRSEEASHTLRLCTCRGVSIEHNGVAVTHCVQRRKGTPVSRDASGSLL